MAEMNSKEAIEETYAKFKDYGENVRKEYEEIFNDMFNCLNKSHLEPFAKILLECENTVLKSQDQIVDSIRNNLKKQMIYALNKMWQECSINESLITLEMCKEKFKPYEGHKWNINSKTPVERTRPIRMNFKENRLRYLQAQLKFQQEQLDEIMKENIKIRQQIQKTKQQRIYLMETMAEYRKKFEVLKPEILRLQLSMLEMPTLENEENLQPNSPDAENI